MSIHAQEASHIVLNNKTHAVNVYVSDRRYLEDMKKLKQADKKGERYDLKVAPSYEVLTVKAGYNMFNDEQWERLMQTKAFRALLEERDIHVNSPTEFAKYDSEVKEILENNVEYKEGLKAKRAAEADSRSMELARLNSLQKKQIDDLESRLAKLEGALK